MIQPNSGPNSCSPDARKSRSPRSEAFAKFDVTLSLREQRLSVKSNPKCGLLDESWDMFHEGTDAHSFSKEFLGPTSFYS